MKKLLLLLPFLFLISCADEEPLMEQPQISPDCFIDANFSGIAYENGCEESFAQSVNSLHQIYITSESEDRNMNGRFYLDNLEVGDRTVTRDFNLVWQIDLEGGVSPSTILTNIEIEITQNDGNQISGNCMVPFDDEGFIKLDTLWMSFDNIVIVN